MTTDTQLAPTDAEIDALLRPFYESDAAAEMAKHDDRLTARAVLARWGAQPTPSSAAEFALQALVAAGHVSQELVDKAMALPGAPQTVEREPLTPREIELIDGMIAVQLDHAMRCDAIANRAMADKQKGWDMERVALLQKFKAAHGIKGGQHGADT